MRSRRLKTAEKQPAKTLNNLHSRSCVAFFSTRFRSLGPVHRCVFVCKCFIFLSRDIWPGLLLFRQSKPMMQRSSHSHSNCVLFFWLICCFECVCAFSETNKKWLDLRLNQCYQQNKQIHVIIFYLVPDFGLCFCFWMLFFRAFGTVCVFVGALLGRALNTRFGWFPFLTKLPSKNTSLE